MSPLWAFRTEFQPGQKAIAVDSITDIPAIIDRVIEAANSGYFDAQMKQISDNLASKSKAAGATTLLKSNRQPGQFGSQTAEIVNLPLISSPTRGMWIIQKLKRRIRAPAMRKRYEQTNTSRSLHRCPGEEGK
jgi:hypothetical protein